MRTDRRTFLAGLSGLALTRPLLAARAPQRALTVRGPVEAADLGIVAA
jgi:hypothetical protein